MQLHTSSRSRESLSQRRIDHHLLQQLKLCEPEELARGEVVSIQQHQNKFIDEKNQRAHLIPSETKGLALWEVMSSSPCYEIYLPPIPSAHIIVHNEGGGRIKKLLDQNEESYVVEKHSISIVPAYTPMYVACFGTIHTVHLTLPSDFIRRTLRTLDASIDPRLQLKACSNTNDAIAAHLMYAIAEYANRSRQHALSSMTRALTLHLLEQYGVIADKPSCDSIDEKQLRLVHELMLSNLGEMPDVDKIAATLQLGTALFVRMFKTKTGLTPLEYYRKLRMQRAKELIETSTKSLTQIAMDLGFTDAAHFSKAFHKQWNFPPSTLRQKLTK